MYQLYIFLLIHILLKASPSISYGSYFQTINLGFYNIALKPMIKLLPAATIPDE